MDVQVEKTGYWLNGIPLWYCRLHWPSHYRGTQHVPVTFYQPASMYSVLAPLKDVGEGGVTLRFKSNKIGEGARDVMIYGVQVLEVELEESGDTPVGCRVVIADRRWRLGLYIMEQNWSVLYQGRFLEGTAKDKLTPYTLDEAMEILSKQPPFKGYMAEGWAAQLKAASRNGAKLYLPDDQLFAGQNLVTTLQKMLEWWSFDLSVNRKGKFYFADRHPGSGDDQGLAKLKAISKALEWVDYAPPIDTNIAKAGLPKNVKVPFWEDHNLLVPKRGVQIPEGATGSTNELTKSGPDVEHGLEAVNVYKALASWYEFRNLVLIYGFTYSVLDEEVRKYLERDRWQGTRFDVTRANSENQKEKLFSMWHAFTENERVAFALVHEDKDAPQKRGAWANFELGVRSSDGVMHARRIIGDWTELPEKITFDWKNIEKIRRGRPTRIELSNPLAIPRRSTATFTGKRAPEAIGGHITVRGESIFVGRELDGPEDEEYDFGQFAPFEPVWQQDKLGVFKLEIDKRRLHAGSDAQVGIPENVFDVLMVSNIDGSIPGKIGGDDPDTRDDYRRKIVEEANLKAEAQRSFIVWDLDYIFWVFINARRMAPNTKDKFWVEEVQGIPDGDVDELWLEADSRYAAIRDYVDYANAENTEATKEKSRPNGNDGYGKILNRDFVQSEAVRRAINAILELIEPRAFSHEFLAYDVPLDVELKGALQSFMIKADGKVIVGEVSVGTISSERARRDEATLRAANQKAELDGKQVRR